MMRDTYTLFVTESALSESPPAMARRSEVLETIKLPALCRQGGRSLLDARSDRRSSREFSDRPLSEQLLSDLPWHQDSTAARLALSSLASRGANETSGTDHCTQHSSIGRSEGSYREKIAALEDTIPASLLAALPPADYERLLPELEPIALPLDWAVYGAGDWRRFLPENRQYSMRPRVMGGVDGRAIHVS